MMPARRGLERRTSFQFCSPADEIGETFTLSILVLSDSYFGLDQQFDIDVTTVEAGDFDPVFEERVREVEGQSDDDEDGSLVEGTLQRFLPEKGFGFIRPDVASEDGETEVFFHVRDRCRVKYSDSTALESELVRGCRVRYELTTDERSGKLK